MHESTETGPGSLRTGARLGLIAWAAYALTEYLFTSFPAWGIKPYFSVWHWLFNAGLFVLYPVIGMLWGGLCGLLVHRLAVHSLLPAARQRQAWMLCLALVLPLALMAYKLLAWTGFKLPILLVFSGLALLSGLPVLFPGLLRRGPHAARIDILLLVLLPAGLFARQLLEPGDTSVLLVGLAGGFWLVLTWLLVRLPWPAARTGDPEAGPFRASRAPVVAALGLLAAVLALDLLFIHTRDDWPVQGGRGAATTAQPNVLLVVLDTVRADHLSVYGYERDTTPELSAFAREATLYEQAISPADMTLSGHGSLFTGLYGSTHGAHYNDAGIGQPLNESFTTLAEALSANDYRTIGIISNHVFFGKDFQLEQGFDYVDARPTDAYLIYHVLGRSAPVFLRFHLHRKLSALVPDDVKDRQFRDADSIIAEALRFLDSPRRANRPFFLFLNLMDAHWRYMPPAGFDTLYPGKIDGFSSADYYRLNREVTKTARREITAAERNHLVSQYDGAIRYMDSRLRLLFDRLRQAGLYDDMLIIITSDHGEAFGGRQLVQHAVSAYQNQLHVPLLIHYPQGARRGRVSTLVSTLSIMPTILAVTGTAPPRELHDGNLAVDNPVVPDTVFAESFPNTSLLGKRFARTERAVFKPPYKLISSTSGKRELYNLELDPEETNNLYRDKPAVSRQLEQTLEQWIAARQQEAIQGPDQALSRDTRDRLKALGYIE